MILYHGTNIEIDTIDLDKCRQFKVGVIKWQFRNSLQNTIYRIYIIDYIVTDDGIEYDLAR